MEPILPAFPDCDHCIVFCADNNFMALTAVAIQSLVETRNPKDKYDVLLLHGGIDPKYEEDYQRMFGGLADFSLRFVNIAEIVADLRFYVENRKGFAQEAYYRLFIPWILSDAYRRALYLDGDMVVRRDVMPVFETAFTDELIAAVRDYVGIAHCYVRGDGTRAYYNGIGLSDVDNYSISATILFHLDAWRKCYSLETVLKTCASKKWKKHDQDVLNVLCRQKKVRLLPQWGHLVNFTSMAHLPRYLADEIANAPEPVIIHYAGGIKPYVAWSIPYDPEFWTVATHTCCFHELLGKCSVLEPAVSALRILQKEHAKEENTYKSTVAENMIRCKEREGFGQVNAIWIRRGILHVEGIIVLNEIPCEEGFRIYCSVNDNKIPAEECRAENMVDAQTGEEVFWCRRFSFDIRLDGKTGQYMLSFLATAGERVIPIHVLYMGSASPLRSRCSNAYYYAGGWMVRRQKQNLVVWRCLSLQANVQERLLLKEGNLNDRSAMKKARLNRPLMRCLRKAAHKPIWLISDGKERAGGDGEALFRYVNTALRNRVRCYFVIGRGTTDYQRLQKYGTVLPLRSRKHKLLLLAADWVITSDMDEEFCNPFLNYQDYYSDLLSEIRYATLGNEKFVPRGRVILHRSDMRTCDAVFQNGSDCKYVAEKLLRVKETGSSLTEEELFRGRQN